MELTDNEIKKDERTWHSAGYVVGIQEISVEYKYD